MIEEIIFSFATGCLLAGAGIKVGAFVERRNRSSGRKENDQRCLDTDSGKLAWDRLATLLGPNACLERREGLPTMGDLRKAFENEQVCQHVMATTAGSVERLASAEPRLRANVQVSVDALEQRSETEELPMDDLAWQGFWGTWAWMVYTHRLATMKLHEFKAARLDKAWQQATPTPSRTRF